MIASSLLALVAGCARITSDTYCDVASPILFGSDATVDYLLRADQPLVVDILIHNETHKKLCS